jgi:hypothetical protein
MTPSFRESGPTGPGRLQNRVPYRQVTVRYRIGPEPPPRRQVGQSFRQLVQKRPIPQNRSVLVIRTLRVRTTSSSRFRRHANNQKRVSDLILQSQE